MITTVPESIKLWGRGQLTIPKEARQALHLEEEDRLSVFVVGRCLILTPKRLTRGSLAKEVEKSMAAEGIKLNDLISVLREERKRYNAEAYGV